MKAIYNQPIFEIVNMQSDVVRTSPAGEQPGDNELIWGENQ